MTPVQNEPNPDDAGSPDSARKAQAKSGFVHFLDIKRKETQAGQVMFELVIDERHLRSFGFLHGGVIVTLLDTTMGTSAGRAAPEGFYVVTVQLNANFIRPVCAGEKLVASSETQHVGRQTVVCRGEVRTSNGQLVASGTATFLFVPHPK